MRSRLLRFFGLEQKPIVEERSPLQEPNPGEEDPNLRAALQQAMQVRSPLQEPLSGAETVRPIQLGRP